MHFLGQEIINPITNKSEFNLMFRLLAKARLDFQMDQVPQELTEALLAWTNQAMSLENVPGWVADPVGLGVLVVRQYRVGQFLWQSKEYPADVVARAFKDLDVKHLQVDRELMEARLENHMVVPYWKKQA